MIDQARAIPEQGRLTDVSLPRLVLGLLQMRFDGTLELTRARSCKSFVFGEGSPFQSDSNLASESLVVQLMAQGTLREPERARVESWVTQKHCSENVALLGLKLLEPKALLQALKEQLRRRLLDCFGWTDGEYRLRPADPVGSEHTRAFRSDPLALVQEGIEIHWSSDRILADLTPHLEKYPQLRHQAAGLPRRLHHDSHSERLVASLNGERSLAHVLASASGSPRALAAIWVLAHAGALAFTSQSTSGTVDGSPAAFEAEIEIEVRDRGEGRIPGTTQKEVQGPAPAGAPQAAASEQAGSLRAEVIAKIEALAQMNHYEALGVDPDARVNQIKKAYFKAAKQYHPDALARLGLSEIRAEAARVFARIAEAFEVLSDDGKRRDYDAGLADHGPAIDAHRVAKAETAYRKGEILVRMGDFRGSLEFLQSAVDLWPEEAAYQSALGWALYKKLPPDPAAARVHLEKAISLDAGDAVACFRLSLVLRSLGENEEANRLAAVARRLDPASATG